MEEYPGHASFRGGGSEVAHRENPTPPPKIRNWVGTGPALVQSGLALGRRWVQRVGAVKIHFPPQSLCSDPCRNSWPSAFPWEILRLTSSRVRGPRLMWLLHSAAFSCLLCSCRSDGPNNSNHLQTRVWHLSAALAWVVHLIPSVFWQIEAAVSLP